MKEYMVKLWGGAWNKDANPSIEKDLGIKEGTHYFSTEEERSNLLKQLRPYEHLGIVRDLREGEMTHKRTIVKMKMKYEEKVYEIEYDFGHEYPEDAATFMFYEGNYSCDCNKSLFIQEKYEGFPELDCGDLIEIVDFQIVYED